ncbi:MAG: SUMF1/EgtB/PvdO family nonheme iron enzyme [Candidatus Latescibacteria bacterium]|nr:SUMF1/EgtB/PvdO family nonheme iron enzyme [Candidatus Latescibacterota bacterium]
MYSISRFSLNAAFTFCFVLHPLTCFGYIAGTITSTPGKPVSGAEVTFTMETDSSRFYTTVTDENGNYRIDLTTSVNDDTESSVSPESFILRQNYPNPFNPVTTIPFIIENPCNIRLDVFNIIGQHIKTLVEGYYAAGSYTVFWDALDKNGHQVSAGVFLYKLSTDGMATVKKMLLLDGGLSNSHTGTISESILNSQRFSVFKKTDITWSVEIKSDKTVTYSESGIVLIDGERYDFVVKLSTINNFHTIKGITFAPIPSGTFRMGNMENFGYNTIEKPVHTVTLSAFEMSIFEITQKQYQALIGSIPENIYGEGDNYPVYTVSWFDAVRFCDKLSDAAGLERCYDEGTWVCDFSKNGFRLPTEAEWEYACRAGTETCFYTGNYLQGLGAKSLDMDNAGWYLYNWGLENKKTHIVGEKEPNAFGLYDMHGNIGEWCNDWYAEDYYKSSPSADPAGPTSGTDRVIRGGSWCNTAAGCRSANRFWCKPSEKYGIFGFRVVRRP